MEYSKPAPEMLQKKHKTKPKSKLTAAWHYQAWNSIHQPMLPSPATIVHTPATRDYNATSIDNVITVYPLPPRPEHLFATDHHTFTVDVTYTLLDPRSISSNSPYRFNIYTAQVLAQQVSTAYISPSHPLSSIVYGLARSAGGMFGLSGLFGGERRWKCVLLAACEGQEGCVMPENFEFILEAGRQGGWSWRFYVVEVGGDGDT